MTTPRQQELLGEWLPGAELVKDLSWGLVGTTVLMLEHDGTRYIVKAGDEADTNIARELRAHREWLEPWTSRGLAPRLAFGDDDAKLLVTHYLPGDLVEGTPDEYNPETYHQAGVLLALLHGQLTVEDKDFEASENEKSLAWLDGPHRIAPDVVSRLRDEINSWPIPPSTLVPTHGDWQPRNWLINNGTVTAIDFGRAELRPAWGDFGRLAAQQFRQDRRLEAAFLDGYGTDPRDPATWRRNSIREAIGTACWAFRVGSEDYEQQGHRMIAEALAAD
ncbi:phosphotransferase [Kribbella lupini]|uniref:Aminoglycoside phosphotransferase domain-containing protein n=1 Tax=Kribbella lupini TaxID=291602 RepID=A0ABN2AI16_9ACTN